MSRLKECIKNGEVKNSVTVFVDAYEDMFDCFVTDISVGAIDDNGKRIDLILRRGVE